MTIDRAVDLALQSYLQASVGSGSGMGSVTIVTGEEDNYPNLTCPYLVIYSNVESFIASNPIFTLTSTIELVTVQGETPTADVDGFMNQVDFALTNETPTQEVMSQTVTTGLSFLGWQAISKTQQNVGEKRSNVRQLVVHAKLA
jgi:hypothetical protein